MARNKKKQRDPNLPEYKIIGSFEPKGTTEVEKAAQKLKTVFDGSSILKHNNDYLSDETRYIIVLGIYDGFYSCFEIIMQANNKTNVRKAFSLWQEKCPNEWDEIQQINRNFRNSMAHQGAYISGAHLEEEEIPELDTMKMVRKHPYFAQKIVKGECVKEYYLYEWIEFVYNIILKALNKIENVRRILDSDDITNNIIDQCDEIRNSSIKDINDEVNK